jgi:hypothetical protein
LIVTTTKETSMAAKKRSTAKKASKTTQGDSVGVALDPETILTLHAAVEALSEAASAIIVASNDPALTAVRKKSATKGSKKSARKSR